VNYALLLPEVIVLLGALYAPLLAFRMKEQDRYLVGYWAVGTLLLALAACLPLLNDTGTLFNGFLIIDAYAMLFKLVFLAVAVLTATASITYVRKDPNNGEYYTLILFATLGMMLVASAGDLITLYVGIELAGISTYALAAFRKTDKRSTEAAMKYFISGAFFSAMLLFGISLVYGIAGSTNIAAVAGMMASADVTFVPFALVAMLFLMAGFGFKMAAVPFQMWAPDTYEGAPDTISAFLAAGSKKMAFAAAFRVFLVSLIVLRAEWTVILGLMAVVSMTFGNVVALAQKNIKRMLAYSSIAQAGYLLVGLVVAAQLGAVGQLGLASSILHIFVHAFMKGGAFIAVACASYMMVGDKVEDYMGLSKRAPVTALTMMVFLISLAGIVPLGGYVSKLFILIAAFKAGGWMVFLGIMLVLNSLVSMYYYGRVIKNMYFQLPGGGFLEHGQHPPEVERLEEPLGFVIPLVAAAAVVMLIGIYPVPFIEMAQAAAAAIIP